MVDEVEGLCAVVVDEDELAILYIENLDEVDGDVHLIVIVAVDDEVDDMPLPDVQQSPLDVDEIDDYDCVRI